MGPGPSNVHPRVLQAMARPTIGHLNPFFVAMMDELKNLLRYAFQTTNVLTLLVSAPGSAGMETCFVNLIEPGDTVIVCQNGVFGGRMKENILRAGASVVMVEDEWGTAVDLNKVEVALKANPAAKALPFVHAETSTGVLSDAKALCALAVQYGALSIVDAVTSLGGCPLLVDEWRADAVYSGSQKCLSCAPGISTVTFNDKAIEAIKARKSPIQSWFMDLTLVMNYWTEGSGAPRAYHHTAPVNALYGLHGHWSCCRKKAMKTPGPGTVKTAMLFVPDLRPWAWNFWSARKPTCHNWPRSGFPKMSIALKSATAFSITMIWKLVPV
jgi:alanine-glyoxylate transaminase/serine-glyoxylate transaminase/serine-pyruvate transaminase